MSTPKLIKRPFTILDLLNVIPQTINETMGLEDYMKTEYEYLDKTYLETQGDIQDIIKLISHQVNWTSEPFKEGKRKEAPIEKFLAFYKFSRACWGVLSHKEWLSLEITKKHLIIYPNLTNTVAIHTWG